MEKTLGTSEIPRLRARQSGVRYRYSTTSNQRIPQKLRASQLRKRFAKLRGRATDDSLKSAIEVRHGLKSACEGSFANSRVWIERQRLRLMLLDELPRSRDVRGLVLFAPYDQLIR